MKTIFKFLYSKKSMKRKILEIVDEMGAIVKPICKEKFWVNWYGAYDIDPKYLVIWICVETDEVKLKLMSDNVLLGKLKSVLVRYEYPEQSISSVHVGFESQETVDRESNGSWYEHFK